MAPTSWNKAVTYIKNKDNRMAYNLMFKPLFESIKKEMREEGCHESVVHERAKEKTKKIIKANSTAQLTQEPSSPEQKTVLPQTEV